MLYDTSSLIFLSTLSLRRATFSCFWCIFYLYISIHALLAESDLAGPSGPAFLYNFYPRSPCGERPSTQQEKNNGHEFLSTLSLRRATFNPLKAFIVLPFLSTLSLRRATLTPARMLSRLLISIHALLAESDRRCFNVLRNRFGFLSTLSLRRATANSHGGRQGQHISIHALLAESDSKSAQNSGALLRI